MTPRFPSFGRAGGYESFYVRAVDPNAPRAVWLRHTVHQAPDEEPVGSAWATIFDAGASAPAAHKLSVPGPSVDGWLRVGDSAIGPGGVHGSAGPQASWDLTWTGAQAPLRHLPAEVLYRAPVPRTKLESPLPAARFDGRVTVAGASVELDGWPGMVGHNWGAQHAERWIWLHGIAFDDAPDAWLDLSLGRIRVGPATTPWVANGMLSAGGERIRLGGLRARPRVRESPTALELELPHRGGALRLTAWSAPAQTVGWRYADPDGSEHRVANCSIARLEVELRRHDGPPVSLRTAHGGAYELGMREEPAGLAIQPFTDP